MPGFIGASINLWSEPLLIEQRGFDRLSECHQVNGWVAHSINRHALVAGKAADLRGVACRAIESAKGDARWSPGLRTVIAYGHSQREPRGYSFLAPGETEL